MVVGQVMVPLFVQQFKVLPNEIVLEKPYISNNIKFTRAAYGLGSVVEEEYNVNGKSQPGIIERNDLTLRNIRLLDHRPLKQTYEQLQEIRLYYSFSDVDIDRYIIDGKATEVMLSARELDITQLPGSARTWVNEHLLYTHGYGVTVSPVNKVTKTGQPEFIISDIPPKSIEPSLNITRPEIYYGERTDNYVIVNSGTEEFDYPKGDKNKYTTYEGVGGVNIGSFFRKLLFALRFSDIKFILSNYILEESNLLFNRNIHDRVKTLAPFLIYDPDPYVVIIDGRLLWIQDAYTFTDKYPYSTPYGSLNYLRNSVKVVIDAYNGDVTYYIIDDTDPIVKTYSNIFPELFKPISQLPSGIKEHFRYPELLFSIQSDMYSAYHMEDPVVFYNKEDLWDIPFEIYGTGKEQLVDPYYVIIKLPDSEKEEFTLMMPFTPHKKDNMIGWLGAKSDENYGKLVLYKFSKDKLIYGPMQIEARIDQDASISQQLTLWGQQGSRVIRGNLLVIPIENSILYIEPLYILAEKSQLPELKRVLVSYGDKVVMKETLDDALFAVFGEGSTYSSDEVNGEPISFDLRSLSELSGNAVESYNKVSESMKIGDWAGIGSNLEELENYILLIKEKTSKASITYEIQE